MTSLLDSLYVLDCYRVCILQRPPSLLWRHLENLRQSRPLDVTSCSIRDLVTTLVNPGFKVNDTALEKHSLGALSGLAPFLWCSMPIALADRDTRQSLLISDFTELAIDKWYRSHRNAIGVAALVLYHLMNIAAHTNFLLVQNYAHLSSASGTSKKNETFYEACILRWVRSRHYEIAKWHAEKLLDTVKDARCTNLRAGADSSQNEAGQTSKLPSPEALAQTNIAHVPYAVYYATLVLWCGAAANNGKDAPTTLSCLTRGRNLLSLQTLRIAAVMEHVLRD